MQAPAAGTPGIMALGNEERLSSVLTEAGFSDYIIEEVPITWRYPDFESYWLFLTEVAGAIATLIESLPSTEQATAKEAIKDVTSNFLTESEIVLPGMTLNAMAQ